MNKILLLLCIWVAGNIATSLSDCGVDPRCWVLNRGVCIPTNIDMACDDQDPMTYGETCQTNGACMGIDNFCIPCSSRTECPSRSKLIRIMRSGLLQWKLPGESEACVEVQCTAKRSQSCCLLVPKAECVSNISRCNTTNYITVTTPCDCTNHTEVITHNVTNYVTVTTPCNCTNHTEVTPCNLTNYTTVTCNCTNHTEVITHNVTNYVTVTTPCNCTNHTEVLIYNCTEKPPCVSDADCGIIEDPCSYIGCRDDGTCGMVHPFGTVCSVPALMCDGLGHCNRCTSDDLCGDQTGYEEACVIPNGCNLDSHTCGRIVRPTGTSCRDASGAPGRCHWNSSCVPCLEDNDCSSIPPTTSCSLGWGCDERWRCVEMLKPPYSPCNDSLMCNTQGACVECINASDCTRPQNDCMIATCTNNGSCGAAVPAPLGHNTTHGYCNGAGNAVPCLLNSHCSGESTQCHLAICVGNICGYNIPYAAACGESGSDNCCDGLGLCRGHFTNNRCRTAD
jgi:hypothetical protein